MSRVVLHIGTHKTATTTIQDLFAHNAALLAQHKVIYPSLGKFTGHHGLVTDWVHALPKSYTLPLGSVGTLRRLAQDYAGTDKTVFLSSEEFSRGASAEKVDFRAVRDALSAFDQIEIICVLREQWQFAQSIYLEIGKYRPVPRPPQIIDSVLKTDLVDGLWTDYNLLLDHLLQAFDPKQISFLDFDRCRTAKGGITGAILHKLGIGQISEELKLVNDGRSNPSPEPLASWSANLIAEPIIPPPVLLEATTGALKVQFGDTARTRLWTRQEFQQLLNYAAPRNKRFTERVASTQPGFCLTTSKPASETDRKTTIFRDDIPADFWLRCSRWTFHQMRKATAS